MKIADMTPEQLEKYRAKRKEYNTRYRAKNLDRIKERERISNLKYRENNPDKVKETKRKSDKKYRLKNLESLKTKSRNYYLENKDRLSAKAKLRYQQNPEPAKLRAKQWKSENRARHNYLCMLRHARKLHATPKWLNEFMILGMQELYSKSILMKELTGVPHEVDHIVPLQGKDVCGLHVPWNLQVITESANSSKTNNLPEESLWLSTDGWRWL